MSVKVEVKEILGMLANQINELNYAVWKLDRNKDRSEEMERELRAINDLILNLETLTQ